MLPKINVVWKINLDNFELYMIELKNIRRENKKFTSIKEIDYKKLWKLLSILHWLDFNNWYTYLHWNLHESNFFQNINWELWFFDLIWMFNWRIEYDFAIIYINSMYDDIFLENLLDNYTYKLIFSYDIFYKIVLQKIIENIKLNRPVKDEWIEWLKKALYNIKSKLWNII
jgi:hypothetical protein